VSLFATLVLITLVVLPLPASGWNIPGHMLSGIVAYQILEQENLEAIEKVKAVLEKHPWYANQWQARLQDVPADRDPLLFTRRQGGPMIFASKTGLKTDRVGITSTYHSNPRGSR
jgi:hypothetical protein